MKTGLGLFALGAVTGNQHLQQTGQALTHLGLVTKGLAHLGKWYQLWKYVNQDYDIWNIRSLLMIELFLRLHSETKLKSNQINDTCRKGPKINVHFPLYQFHGYTSLASNLALAYLERLI